MMTQLSPRDRRLRSDLEAMQRLQEQSSIIRFVASAHADLYTVTFLGSGVWRDPASNEVRLRHEHVVTIGLTAAYPRMMPELSWRTPIFHPNISAGGVVCLGGYQTHWVPSLKLDELCQMLWDMTRYANYDVESPYNREAAIWAKSHAASFPLDNRPLRDRFETAAPSTAAREPFPGSSRSQTSSSASMPAAVPVGAAAVPNVPDDEVIFLEAEVIESAEVEPVSDILFID